MLNVDLIKERISPICKKFGVKRAFLFGSYARGSASEKSDVDIRIEKGSIRDLFQMSEFRLDLVDALGLEIDLLSVEPEHKVFRENLKKDEILIYED